MGESYPMTDEQFAALWSLLDTKNFTYREMQAIDDCLKNNSYGNYAPDGWGGLVLWARENVSNR